MLGALRRLAPVRQIIEPRGQRAIGFSQSPLGAFELRAFLPLQLGLLALQRRHLGFRLGCLARAMHPVAEPGARARRR